MTAKALLATRARQGLGGLGLATAAALYLAFALPASIWLGNRAEFEGDWAALLSPFLFVALKSVLACAVLAALAGPGLYARGRVLFATLVLLAWVQGTLLVWNYGLFNGSRIDWSVGQWRGWVDAALWVAALLAADAYRERVGHILVRAAVVLCLAQAAITATSLLSAGGQPAPPARGEDVQAALADFSPESNVLHLVADGFQTDIFADLLAESGPEPLAGRLDGFVFYRDNLGAFPFTHLAVPALMGGRLYGNDEPLPAFVGRALGRDSIFGAARRAGYEVEIGVPAGGLAPIYQAARDARVLAIPAGLNRSAWRTEGDESLLLADLALFRLAPHFAKRLVYNDQKWFLQMFYRQVLPNRRFLEHNALLRAMAAGLTTDRKQPTYKVLHLMLSHQPWVARPDCTHAGVVLPDRRAHVRDQARCSLRSMLELLDAMRREGIYDSATIVISGDHGSFVPPLALGGDKAVLDPVSVWVGHARPLLLVKPPGGQGPLRVSDAPTWIIDTPATIADAAGIAGTFPGVAAARLPVDEARERRYHLYEYSRAEWTADYVTDILEILVRGRSDDPSGWRYGRWYRPPGAGPAPPPGQLPELPPKR